MDEAKKQKEHLSRTTVSLSASIKEHFANSVVFNTSMFEHTMGTVCERISAHTGKALI